MSKLPLTSHVSRLRLENGDVHLHVLPPELLLKIFLIGRDLDADYPDDHMYLLRMRSVCRIWRYLVLSAPELWTNINLKEVAGRSPKRVSLARPKLKETLARSKDASLDITLVLGSGTTRNRNAVETIVEEDILPHLHRARSLAFDFHMRESISKFFPLKSELKRLKSFRLCWSHSFAPPTRIFEAECTPMLDALDIGGWNSELPSLYLLMDIPLGSLRRFALDLRGGQGNDWGDIAEVLRRCVNVEELVLKVQPIIPSNARLEPFSLLRLRSLRASHPFVAIFQRSVSTPNLEELTIFHAVYVAPEGTEHLHPLSHKLHTIYNEAFGMGPRKHVHIYEAHPTIKTLATSEIEQYRGIIASLLGIVGEPTSWTAYVPNDPQACLFPLLETLEVRGVRWGEKYVPLVPLIRLLDLRPRLRVIFKVYMMTENYDRDALEQMKEQYGERFTLAGDTHIIENTADMLIDSAR